MRKITLLLFIFGFYLMDISWKVENTNENQVVHWTTHRNNKISHYADNVMTTKKRAEECIFFISLFVRLS